MRFRFIVIILPCLILVGCLLVFLPISINSEPVEVKFRYMAYACGNCYPQYKVYTIQPTDTLLDDFVEKEFWVEFDSQGQEKSVMDQSERCMICCEFLFTGYFKKSIYKGTFLK
jgi:hypothetical protein